MPPVRTRTTPLGEALRAARKALKLDQAGLAERIFVSSRQVSRWENGGPVHPQLVGRLYRVLEGAPKPITAALADALGLDVSDDDEPDVAQAGSPAFHSAATPPLSASPASPASPRVPQPSAPTARAALDAVVFTASENRDVLPRHLRAFAVELLHAVDRLGLSALDAAAILVKRDTVDTSATNERNDRL